MRVKVTRSYDNRVIERDLEDVLKPEGYDSEGSVERVRDQAEANAKAIGRLLAFMVKRNQMGLQEACDVAGYHGDVTQLEQWDKE